MTRKKSKLRILRNIGITLFLAIAVLYTIFTIVASGRLQSQMSTGHILTVQDIENEKVPDHENAAVVYEQIFKVMESPAVDDSRRYLTNQFYMDKENKDPLIWDKARKTAKNTETIINLTEQAVNRPGCRMPYDYKNMFAGSMENMARLREISRILYTSTLLAAHDGETGKACHLTGLNFELAKSLGNERTHISHLVMTALIMISTEGLRQVSTLGDITEKQLLQLDDILSEFDIYQSHYKAVEGERAYSLWMLDFTESAQAMPNPSSFVKGLSYVVRPYIIYNKSVYLDISQKNMQFVNQSYREVKVKRPFAEEDQIPSFAAFIKMTYSPDLIYQGMLARDRTESVIRGNRIFLALLLYKKQFGSYPQTLAELKNKTKYKLNTIDLLSGNDFIYQRKGSGFILYGFGENMKDDGGTPRPQGSSSKGGPDDIVWEMGR